MPYNFFVDKVPIAATIWQGEHHLEGDRSKSQCIYDYYNKIIRSADNSVCELRSEENRKSWFRVKLCSLT